MNDKNEKPVMGDENDLIERAIQHQVAKIKPSSSFINRLALRLRHKHDTETARKGWRIPVWGYAAAIAALVIVVFVVRGLWPGQVVPAIPTDVVVTSETPEIEPTPRPTDVPPPTPTEAPTPEPEPSFAADLPPAIVKAIPRPGEEVNAKAGILLRFTQPMDKESVERALKVQPLVEGTFAWEDDRTVTFNPKVLASGVRYHVSVSVDALATNGKSLTSELVFDFSTIGPLEVAHASPIEGTTEVRSDTPLIVTTNYPMVPINCTGQVAGQDGQCAVLPVQIVPNITGQGMWVNTSVYRFDPLPGWDAGTAYQITLPSGTQSVGGAELPEAFTWSFETALPRVIQITPANRAVDVRLDTAVEVRFNTPMATRITEQAFELFDDLGSRMDGTFTWTQNNISLVFTPTQLLKLDTSYTVRVADTAQGVNGAGLSQEGQASFVTVPPPSVLRIGSQEGDQKRVLDYYESLVVEFRGFIDSESLDENIIVTDDGETVDVNVWLNTYDEKYTAYLNWDKTPGAEYCVTVLEGIRDIYGNVMRGETRRCILGADLPSFFGPATHMDTLSLDAAEPARLYFVGVNLDSASFTLYNLSEYGFGAYKTQPGAVVRRWSLTFEGNRNEFQTMAVDLAEDSQPLPTGYYQLSWSADTDRQYNNLLRIAVVDRHITLKMAEDEALVWVTDLRTALPIEGASVRVLKYTGQLLGTGVTDADGVARFAIPPQEELWDTYLAVSGEPGLPGFGVARSDWNQGVGPWNFDISANYSPPPVYALYLHTDRPIYRPGQKVYFRGIVRVDDDARYSLPSVGTPVNLKLYDAYHDEVSEFTLETSASGLFDGEITLPVDGNLGTYSLNVERTGDTDNGTSIQFTVAAYRKPEFEVLVNPEYPEMLSGQDARVLVEANYYAGGDVSHARLHWTVSAQPHPFDPRVPGWWNWGHDPFGWEWWREPEVLAEGDATTDANGNYLWEWPVELQPLGNQDQAGPQKWRLEVKITDEAGFPVTGRGEWRVHTSAYYLGLKPRSWIAYAGMPAEVDVWSLDWEAQPVAAQTFTVQLAKRTWKMITADEPYAAPKWEHTDEIESSLTVTTDNAGKAVVSVTPSQSGSYVVIAEGTDQYGNAVSSETYLWVAGEERVVWQQPENQVKPIADARSYQVGDVARILLPTSFTPPYEVLMTVERAGILHVERLTMDVSNPVIELPVSADFVPNAIVSFTAVKGIDSQQTVPDVRIGMVELVVEPTDQLLTVDIKPSCKTLNEGLCTYEPGERALLNIQTLDIQGVPVVADIAVAVVDKAVLALADPNSLTLREALYASRPLGVFMGDGLVALFNRSLADLERLAQQASQIAREMLYGGIGGGGGGAAYQADVRTDFPDTALWEAKLRTDADGKVQVRLDLPDSLTTWVVDARAVTDSTQVGQNTAEFIVTKPLIVRPVTPRFFTAGDQAEVAAVVQNNTSSDLTVSVRLDADGVILDDTQPAAQRLVVPANGRARAAWKVSVPLYGADHAYLTFIAEGGGYSDAARPSVGREEDHALPLYRYESPEVFSTSGQLTQAGTRLEAVVIPPEAGPDSVLTLRLDPTLAAGMLDSLSYLEHFPHECNEQLVSRFLPNVVSYLALKELGYQDTELEDKLWTLISEALNTLMSRQLPNGGWGWWSESSDFQVTAYAALGMLEAQRTGFTVNWTALDAAVDHVVRTLDAGLRTELRTSVQAFALYVLSEGGYAWPTGAGEILFVARDKLGISGRAFLALAMGIQDPNDPRVQTLLEDLRSDAEITASGTHWEGETGEGWHTWTRTTAVVLEAFARLAPEDPLIPQTVRWLMIARKADRWETTQETAWAVIALTDALVATGELRADYAWGAALNQEVLDQGQLTPETLRQPIEITTSVKDMLREWPNALEISRGDGAGVLYYTADLALYLPVGDLKAESRGISVERQYCVYDPVPESPSESGDAFKPCVPITSAKSGDLIEVRLTVTLPRLRNYLVLEDPYPAGMEPVDPSLKTESDLALEPKAERIGSHSWWYASFTHSELRDERAVFYASSLSAGTYQMRYLLRASLPGEYQVRPAAAHEMYFPSVFGRSDAHVFTVVP